MGWRVIIAAASPEERFYTSSAPSGAWFDGIGFLQALRLAKIGDAPLEHSSQRLMKQYVAPPLFLSFYFSCEVGLIQCGFKLCNSTSNSSGIGRDSGCL